MPLYSALIFFTLAIFSSYAYLVANGGSEGGAPSFNFGQGGGASLLAQSQESRSILADFFQLFAGVSDLDKARFFEILKNESLSVNEVQSELQAWAASHNKTEVFTNITQIFNEKKAEFQSHVQEIIANASLSPEAKLVISQVQTILNNQSLTRLQIAAQIKSAFANASNVTKEELDKAFAPLVAIIKSKFSGQGGFFSGQRESGSDSSNEDEEYDSDNSNEDEEDYGQTFDNGNSNLNSNGQSDSLGNGGQGIAIYIQPIQRGQFGPSSNGGASPQVFTHFLQTASNNENRGGSRTRGNRNDQSSSNNNAVWSVDNAGSS